MSQKNNPIGLLNAYIGILKAVDQYRYEMLNVETMERIANSINNKIERYKSSNFVKDGNVKWSYSSVTNSYNFNVTLISIEDVEFELPLTISNKGFTTNQYQYDICNILDREGDL